MKKLYLSLATMIFSLSLVAMPVFADDNNANSVGNSTEVNDQGNVNCVSTSILGDGGGQFCDDTNGGGVIKILQDVVNIMTVGIGVLGVIGITVVGIQYLTAGGSEEKTRTAKRRMLEIVIGLVAYAIVYAFLIWLLPNFNNLFPWNA